MPRRAATLVTGQHARGPYRVGDETRRLLLDAALALFSRHGFDATTTRQVSSLAGVALPAIAYHFGGKQGLHLACADHVVDRYRDAMLAPLQELERRLVALTSGDARAALGAVVAELVRILIPAAVAEEPWLSFMIREMGQRGEAHDRLYEGLWSPGLGLIAALIARIRNRDAPVAADRLDALLLLSTPSVFGYAQPVATRLDDWLARPAELVAALNERLARSIALL